MIERTDAPRRDDGRFDFRLERSGGFDVRAFARPITVDVGEEDGADVPAVDLARKLDDILLALFLPPLDCDFPVARVESHHHAARETLANRARCVGPDDCPYHAPPVTDSLG